MKNIDKIKNMSIKELAEFLDNIGFEGAPWAEWFENKYCNNCESVIVKTSENAIIPNESQECCYCEVNHGKCKFFQDKELAPNSIEMLLLWLEAESEEETS